MFDQDRLQHNLDGLGPTDRALSAGYDCEALVAPNTYRYGLSENIHRVWTMDSRIPARAVTREAAKGWMNSPGHRENILDPDSVRIGIGVYGYAYAWYATQNFSACKQRIEGG